MEHDTEDKDSARVDTSSGVICPVTEARCDDCCESTHSLCKITKQRAYRDSPEQRALNDYWAAKTPEEERHAVDKMKSLSMWKDDAPEALASTTNQSRPLFGHYIGGYTKTVPHMLGEIKEITISEDEKNTICIHCTHGTYFWTIEVAKKRVK